MSTYKVEVTREGRWWMVSVPSIDGLTQARHVAEIPQMARELIAVQEDLKISDVDVHVRYVDINGVPGDRIAEVESHRHWAAAMSQLAATQTAELARQLVSAQVPLREVADLIGISYQRVHQLVAVEPSEGAPLVDGAPDAEVIDLVDALRRSIEAKRSEKVAGAARATTSTA